MNDLTLNIKRFFVTAEADCPQCEGAGTFADAQNEGRSVTGFGGAGWAIVHTCTQCNGTGEITLPVDLVQALAAIGGEE